MMLSFRTPRTCATVRNLYRHHDCSGLRSLISTALPLIYTCMNDSELFEIYETMLYQQKLLLDVKVQIESLKAMMFEHRPAFTEAFAQQVDKIVQTPEIQQFRAQIAELEASLNKMR